MRSSNSALKSSSTVVDGPSPCAGSAPLNNRTCPRVKLYRFQNDRKAYRDGVAFNFTLSYCQTRSSELDVLLRQHCISGISAKMTPKSTPYLSV